MIIIGVKFLLPWLRIPSQLGSEDTSSRSNTQTRRTGDHSEFWAVHETQTPDPQRKETDVVDSRSRNGVHKHGTFIVGCLDLQDMSKTFLFDRV